SSRQPGSPHTHGKELEGPACDVTPPLPTARARARTHTPPTHTTTPCPLSPPCKLVAFTSQSLGCDLKDFRQQQSDPGGALDRQPHLRRLGPPSRDASGGLGKHFHPLLSSTLAGWLPLLQDSDVSLRSAVRSADELPTVPQAGSYWGSGQPWGPLGPWPSGSLCLRNMEATPMTLQQKAKWHWIPSGVGLCEGSCRHQLPANTCSPADSLAPSYFQSLQECQLGPGPQATAPHTVLDLDSDCGSTVPLTLISGSNQT
uniref:Uncharacterized protein n=1 Tax=Pongo abelii TaxID=9601 RepID=A0A8I5YMW5_PONAB